MSAIRLVAICKSFGASAPVLNSFDLAVAPGERLAIVGPSGAGKTTLLRLIAGFDKPDTGKIFIGERDITNLPPEQRDIAFVFQTHALYPHLTVQENLEFPLRLRKMDRSEIAERVKAMASLLRIARFLNRKPFELSGGEAQRVALGRALIRKPAILLMDEPLSSLPPDLRSNLRRELVKLHAANPLSILYVTHDHEEALAIGQRVAVIHDGRIQQIGSPQAIYTRPLNRFVAGFIGRPPMNFVPADKVRSDGAVLGVRPEHFEICGAEDAWFQAEVEHVDYGGFHSDIVARFKDGNVAVRTFGNREFKPGEIIHLRMRRENIHVFAANGDRLES